MTRASFAPEEGLAGKPVPNRRVAPENAGISLAWREALHNSTMGKRMPNLAQFGGMGRGGGNYWRGRTASRCCIASVKRSWHSRSACGENGRDGAAVKLWLVRAGRHGEDEAWVLEQSRIEGGYSEVPSLEGVQTTADIDRILQATYPEAKAKTRINWRGQLWALTRRMSVDDFVVVPLKTRPSVAIGKIRGPYIYRADEPVARRRHTREVAWLGEWPRTAFDQDLLYSFGAFMNVCQIQRNEAERRVRRLVEGAARAVPVEAPAESPVDWEAMAAGQVQSYIAQHVKGHDLARLVAAILESHGYKARVSPPGADGGVDVLAGAGPLGFDSPRLAVQVKSGSDPTDITVLHQLQGAMGNVGAEQGLLVSLGGFRRSVLSAASTHFFSVRLWDSQALFEELTLSYPRLDDEWQRRVPLKRLWVLEPEAGGDASADLTG